MLSEAAEAGRGFFQSDAYIENQAFWTNVRFGSFSMSYSGCEIIATCNALRSLGHPVTARGVCDLIRWYERNGAVLSGGFGVNPRAIYRYFLEKGYPVSMKTARDSLAIQTIGTEYDTVILTVYNDADNIMAQIHTVNISKETDGRFLVHNDYKRNNGGIYVPSGPYADLPEAVRHLARGSASPISVIGVKKRG